MRRYLTSRNAAFFAAGGFVAALFLAGAAHAITSTIFQYSTAKTGYYGLSPSAFVPESAYNADGYYFAPDPIQLGLENGHTIGCFTTGVNLPQGAKITAFTVWYATDTSSGVTADLFRNKVSDGSTGTIASQASTDTSVTRKGMNVTANSTLATVDNRDYVYSVEMCLNTAASFYFSGRITYTYTNAGD